MVVLSGKVVDVVGTVGAGIAWIGGITKRHAGAGLGHCYVEAGRGIGVATRTRLSIALVLLVKLSMYLQDEVLLDSLPSMPVLSSSMGWERARTPGCSESGHRAQPDGHRES